MGDVLGITEADGNFIAQYLYDEWGKLLSIDTADEEGETAYREIAEANPLRCRGYYFDSETGYYYLQSRYYDPEICRFINADDVNYVDKDVSNGINIFAYCNNDSINNTDNLGTASSPSYWQILCKFLKNYLLRGKTIVKYSPMVKDPYNLHSVKVYYKKSKNNTNAFKITFGYKMAWKKNTTWTNNLGKNQKAINNYYNKVNSVMTSSPPITQTQANKNRAQIISSNIGMGIQMIKSGFSALSMATKYNKVWGKNGMDYNNYYNYILFWVTSEIALNGLYVYRYSTGYVKKL